MLILVVKIVLAALLALAFGLSVFFQPRLDSFFRGRSVAWLALMWLGLRLLPFIGLYVVAGFKATSDLIGFYNGAVAARQGLVPYRDFITVYAPFYPYITAIALSFWDDARSIIVLMMVVEGFILWGAHRIYRLSLTTALQYLLLPATLLFCVVGGQEDIWMWGFGLLTVPLLRRNHTLLAGLVLGLALVATKALFILFIPIFFFWTDRKVRLVVGMLLVGVPVLVWIFALGKWAFLMPVQLTQDPLAPNLRSVLHPLLSVFPGQIPINRLNYAALTVLIILSSVATLRWKKAGLSYRSLLARAWVLVYTGIMLLVPSAYAVYTFGFMLPLMAGGLPRWRQKRSLTVLVVLNLLTVIQPTAWWRMGQHTYSLTDLGSLPFLLEYLMQVGIVGCLLYVAGSLWPRANEGGTVSRRHRLTNRLPAPKRMLIPFRIGTKSADTAGY